MNKFKSLLLKILFIVVLIGAIIVLIKVNKKLREEVIRIDRNLRSSTMQYATESERIATKSQALEIELKDLRQVNRVLDENLSDYEKKLKKSYQIIEDQNKKLKEIQAVNLLTMEAQGSDTVFYEITKIDTVYQVSVSDFDDGYLKAHFKAIDELNLKMEYLYQDDISVVVTREKDTKDTRFFLCRWFKPRYVNYSTATTGNKNAKITVNDYILVK